MTYYQFFKSAMLDSLIERKDVDSTIRKIELDRREVAFYPAGRLSKEILEKLREDKPEIFKKVIGVYDNSDKATTSEGVNLYPTKDLAKLSTSKTLLVVTSNTFYDRDLASIVSNSGYKGEIIKLSSFESTLPRKEYRDLEILDRIEKVYRQLADDKSKSTYMVAWLSRLTNDRSLTKIFETEEDWDVDSEPMNYNGMKIFGVDRECKRELRAGLYKTKEVKPEKGDTIFDIGAYKGDTAIFFASEVGKDGVVYAFEPMPGNYKDLRKNVAINGLGNIIIPVNLGISDKKGNLNGVAPESGAPWAYIDGEGTSGNQQVEVTTIDKFGIDKKVDFIKMDVEGLEEKVINGGRKTIAEQMPKLAIAAYHKTTDLFLIPELINQISNNGYELYFRSKIDGPFGFTFYAKKRVKEMTDYSYLEQKSIKLRRDVLDLSMKMKEGHLGGSFSEIEILVGLYENVLKEEDIFILSKGHASFPYYLLLRERGFSPHISTHPEKDPENGIYCTTGSLGHGLPQAVGISLGKKLANIPGKTYVLMSDGECQEGTTWEALMIASHHKLDNLVGIVDRNGVQSLDNTENILSLKNLKAKFEAFGTYVQEIDGHSYKEITEALEKTKKDYPSMIIANTVKGQGLSFMINDAKWHTRLPNEEELLIAEKEIGYIKEEGCK